MLELKPASVKAFPKHKASKEKEKKKSFAATEDNIQINTIGFLKSWCPPSTVAKTCYQRVLFVLSRKPRLYDAICYYPLASLTLAVFHN